ncbi:tachylectin-related carbohydrate-binding protein, partial [Streptomyces sp. TRM76130]|nr:tachylectin-related carbohydrate-binding protein [Streptomyces sp. TRM76130]
MTAAAALPVVALAPTPAQAAAAVTCASTGPTYAVDTAGNLLRQAMPTPLTGGTMPSPSTIDTGWSGYGQVMAGPDQELYGVKSDGLYLSRRTSSGTWDIHHKKISNN